MPLDEAPAAGTLQLAGWMADPAGWLPAGMSEIAGLPRPMLDSMAASPVLRPALNRWLMRQVGLDRIALDVAALARLFADPQAGAAVALLTASDAAQVQAARMLGAALWADRIRMALLKSDRDRLAQDLGTDAMAFGLRRAVVFARPLTELGAASAAPDPVTAGRALCAALLGGVSPMLATLFRLRHPGLAAQEALTPAQAQAAWSVLSLPEARR